MELTLSPWYKKPWWWLVIIAAAIAIVFVIQVIIEWRQLGQPAAFTPLGQKVQTSSTSAQLIELFNPALGPADAPLQIVEFGDFSCPYCRQAVPALRQFLAAHPGQVRLVYRHFPLADVHPRAQAAAIAAVCANDQGKFWLYHDKLFMNQERHQEDDLVKYAGETGLNMPLWQSCRRAAAAARVVSDDFQAGLSLGVDGTPTFFINGARVAGVLPLADWEQIFNRLVKF